MNELQEALGAEIEAAGSLKAFAAKSGFSVQFISDVRNGRRNASPRLMKIIGLERVVSYRKAKEGGRV